MNVLNKYFNKVYVISSYATQNRLNDLIPFLNKESIEFELIIAPKKKYFDTENEDGLWLGQGNFSCLCANESIFLKEYYEKSESFCILEDDIHFDIDYCDKLINFFNKLPFNWEILNLGFNRTTPINEKIFQSDTFYKLQNNEEITGTHIVCYKKNLVPFILDKIEKNKVPIDWFLNRNIYSHFNTYTCVNKIFYGSSFRNSDQGSLDFYTKYKSEVG